jgi:hypothetical protein
VTATIGFVSKANLVALHLRSRAWWRLDSAGATAVQVARSVVALLDAAAYLRDVSDDDPDIRALADAGRFSQGAFDPGPAGAWVIRGWQLSNQASAGPRDLLKALARAAAEKSPAGVQPVGEPVEGQPVVPAPRPATSSDAPTARAPR